MTDKPNPRDDETSYDDAVYLALRNAKKVFEDTLSEYLYEPSYCDIQFTAFIKDVVSGHRFKRVEIEGELKDEEKI